jgi:CBS domain-containing protein
MQAPMKSMEQLMPFATAAELIARKREPPVWIPPTASVFDAVQCMTERRVSLLVVLDAEQLVGVVSERDCAVAAVLRAVDPRATPVREIMTREVHTAPPEWKIPECVMVMHEKAIRHLPIVAQGRVHGVLSVRDLMGALIERHERLLRRFQEERLTLLFPDPSSY